MDTDMAVSSPSQQNWVGKLPDTFEYPWTDKELVQLSTTALFLQNLRLDQQIYSILQ